MSITPFLFSIVMMVIIQDSRGALFPGHILEEIFYVDDTLLIGREPKQVQEYLNCIASEGRKYGLMLNCDKFEMMQINNTTKIIAPDGTEIAAADNMKYLGALLTKTGNVQSELGRRIGLAKQEFSNLDAVWKRPSITKERKLQIFRSRAISK